MPEKEKSRLEIEQEKGTGGLTLKALDSLVSNSRLMGWRSLSDESLRQTLIPVLDTQVLPHLKRSKVIDKKAVEIGLRIAKAFAKGREALPNFWKPEEEKNFDQIRLAIIQYEANKLIKEAGGKIPFQPLRPDSAGRKTLIRVGNAVPPLYAPIPDERIHNLIIPLVANTPEKLNFRQLVASDTEAIIDNIRVLNLLFGTKIKIPGILRG